MNAQLLQGLGEMVLMLLVMVGLILGLAWLVKRTKGFAWQGQQSLRLIQTLAVGPKERAVLVELEGQRILLGVTANQINTLWQSTLQAPDIAQKDPVPAQTADEKIRLTLPQDYPASGFSDCLKKILVREWPVKTSV